MTHNSSTDNHQSRTREFVHRLAEKGGFEQYWIQIHGTSLNRTEKDTVLAHCHPTGSDDVILDAGCGEGRLAFALARLYRHVYAMDFSQASCERLMGTIQERSIKNITVWCQDLRSPGQFFQTDAVVLAQVLQHFARESDRLTVLKNLRRCLKVGGKIVCTVFNHSRLCNKLRHMKTDVDKTDGYPYYHYFEINELEDLLSRAGFDRISIYGCINLPARFHEISYGNIVSLLDTAFSRYSVSKYFGIYLLAEGIRESSAEG